MSTPDHTGSAARLSGFSGSPGAPPGTLVARPGAAAPVITAWTYGAGQVREQHIADLEELPLLASSRDRVWVEVTGLADTRVIEGIGRAFELHRLSLEDVLSNVQRPKVEQYAGYTFVVLKTLKLDSSSQIEAERISMVLGERFVLTFQDTPIADLDPVRDRLRHGRGRLRDTGVDYLAYAIVDAVVDHYFPVTEQFDDRLEQLEDEILEATTPDPIMVARNARRDLQTIRHVVWPMRDVIASLLLEDAAIVTAETRVYLRDCYDHIVQLQDMLEGSREIAASLLESYLSSIGLKTNQAMKLLTVIATIFLPLTFITGVYGMNFNPARSPFNLPELNWYWGYPFSWTLMVGTGVGLLLYFRRQGWL